MSIPDKDVAAFLASLPDDSRSALERLRQTIVAAAPEATEKIGYGVPAFYYQGRPLVSYAAAKNHCSLYVQSPAVMEAHQAELEGYDISKGTVRFRPEQPLPEALVTKLVKARMEETDAAKSG